MPRSLPPSSRTSASTSNPALPASFARSVKSEIITWRSSTTPTASAARCPPPTSLRPSTASSKSCGATAAATSIPKTPGSSSSVWPSGNSKPDAGAASPPPSKPPSISSTPSFSHDSRAKNESLRHKILDKCPSSVWPSPNSKPDAGAASPPPSKPPSISSTPSFSHDSRAKNESLRHKILDKCLGHQHLHALSTARPPHPQAHAIQEQVRPFILQRRLLKRLHQTVQMAAQLRDRLRAHDLARQDRYHPPHLPRRDAVQERLPNQQHHFLRPPLKSLQARRPKASLARARHPQTQRPQPRHEIANIKSVAIAAPSLPRSFVVLDPHIAARSFRDCSSKNSFQASRVFPYRSPQNVSFRSRTKCWNCSVICVTFLMGCKLLSRIWFFLTSRTNLHPPPFYTQKFTSPSSGALSQQPEDLQSFTYQFSRFSTIAWPHTAIPEANRQAAKSQAAPQSASYFTCNTAWSGTFSDESPT